MSVQNQRHKKTDSVVKLGMTATFTYIVAKLPTDYGGRVVNYVVFKALLHNRCS
jgi:hypothetical protein